MISNYEILYENNVVTLYSCRYNSNEEEEEEKTHLFNNTCYTRINKYVLFDAHVKTCHKNNNSHIDPINIYEIENMNNISSKR